MNSNIKTKKNLKTVVSKSTYTYDKELRDTALLQLHHSSSYPTFYLFSGVDAMAGGRPLLVWAFPLLPPSMSGH